MIIGMMLVKNEADRYLRKVLEQMFQICDKIIILDDCSTDNTMDICLEYTPYVYGSDKSEWATNEVSQRKRLWDITRAFAKDGDWILCLDADETMTHVNDIKKVIEIADINQVKAISFKLYDMWNDKEYRDDQYWTAHQRDWVFMVRYDVNNEYEWREQALHCGRFPVNAFEGLILSSSMKVQHWGWATKEDREKKYKRYMEADPNGEYGILAQYQSILDEKPNLKEFV